MDMVCPVESMNATCKFNKIELVTDENVPEVFVTENDSSSSGDHEFNGNCL